ncbi:hypothetical protein CO2235_50030 [Cupriavidus oxalaticus]|uniref:Uncharacterized protein n=1 Tax=Cupriavidus oxalaticus TaxID=96344 RepID=A0A976GB91_9BURK|nr:hypothetical protein CO2235_50030 [Cupriavidus oxalaticus]
MLAYFASALRSAAALSPAFSPRTKTFIIGSNYFRSHRRMHHPVGRLWRRVRRIARRALWRQPLQMG